jgi:phage-related protein
MFGSVLTILKAAAPITRKFVEWIAGAADKFDKFIKKADSDKSLTKFFEDSAKFASKFGDIFGNIFKGIGALISDAFKPGSGASILLDWLDKVTSGFADMGKDKGLHDFLAGTATNFTKMLDVLGGLFDIFNKLGSDPNLGIMWDTLGKGLPLLDKILSDGAAAGPKMAEVVYQVTRIISAFSDSKTLEVFFDTLVNMATVAADFFNNPNVKKFMDWLGQIHGWILAVGLGFIIAKKAGMILLGSVFKLLSPFKTMYGFFKKTDGVSNYTKTLAKVKSAYETVALKAMYAKDAMVRGFNTVKDVSKQAWQDMKMGVKLWADQAKEAASKFATKVKDAMVAAKDAVAKGFQTIKDVGSKAWQDMKTGVKLWADQVKGAAQRAGARLKSAFDAAKGAATNLWNSAKNGFATLVAKSKEAAIAVGTRLKGAFMGAVGGAKKLWGSLVNVSKALWANTLQVMKNVAQWVAQKAALVASAIASAAMRVAQIAQNVVTAIATGVQAAFNAVMAVNPIVWIVLAIAALVAALIWFFTQTELGKKIWQGFMDFLTGLWNGIVDVVKAVVNWIVQAWNGLVEGVKFVFKLIGDAISFYINIWVTIFRTVIDIIVGIWNGLVNGIKVAIDWVVGVFKTAWDGVTSFFKGLINGLIGMFEGFINFAIDGVNNIIGALSTLKIDIPDWVPVFGGQTWGINIPKIPKFKLPRLADGGVVSPSQGGSLVNVAEAGKPERIEPLDENGMSKRDKAIMDMLGNASGMNITVNPSAGMDETALAALVSRRIAFELRKGATA